MIQFDLITDLKLRTLVQESQTLMSLPEDQLQQLVVRFSHLDAFGRDGMIKLLEQQGEETKIQEENTKKQIGVMETMTAKVVGAERQLERLIRKQQEQPEEAANQTQAENLLGQL